MRHNMRVALVACSKTKSRTLAKAKDLYMSPLFKLSRAYAERIGRWAILSAKHGVVDPEVLLEPYDLTLQQMTKTQRSEWACATNIELQERFGDVSFIVLAGKLYGEALEGLSCEFPLGSLSFGRRLRFLKHALYPPS